jgi:DNA gyrase subunit B
MREMIERGNLYIAQPPLFKVKKGKQEMYKRDERALEDYIIENGTDGLTVVARGSLAPFTSGELKAYLRRIIGASKLCEGLERSADSRVFRAAFATGDTGPSDLRTAEAAALLGNRIAGYLAKHHSDAAPIEFSTEPDEEYGTVRLLIRTRRHGLTLSTTLDYATMTRPEVAQLRRLYGEMRQLGAWPYDVAVENGVQQAVDLPEGLLEQVMNRGRKGLAIQRYKGLGEMNPEQLWETTMNVNTRTLLKVNIVDAVEADQVFTLLMGDFVEPRRDFITQNALNVRNLDI